MSKKEKISPFVRAISGVLGVLGFGAIAFNASQDGGLTFNFMLLASFFAGYVFLYVSFFGKYPWDGKDANDAESDGTDW